MLKKRLIILFLIGFIFLFITQITNAQDNRATCDLCGYCPGYNPTPPSTWEACCQCLYPSIVCNPTNQSTLEVVNNIPITPEIGRWYGLGQCISYAGGFSQRGAASSLAQTIINLISRIAGGIAFLYLIYGSFVLLTSQDEPEKKNHAKKIITGALIGLVIAFSAIFIINIIATNVLKIPGF